MLGFQVLLHDRARWTKLVKPQRHHYRYLIYYTLPQQKVEIGLGHGKGWLPVMVE
jgi:hypothetical protein